jgi:hypothetical protein
MSERAKKSHSQGTKAASTTTDVTKSKKKNTSAPVHLDSELEQEQAEGSGGDAVDTALVHGGNTVDTAIVEASFPPATVTDLAPVIKEIRKKNRANQFYLNRMKVDKLYVRESGLQEQVENDAHESVRNNPSKKYMLEANRIRQELFESLPERDQKKWSDAAAQLPKEFPPQK